jgi:hypothetical protein
MKDKTTIKIQLPDDIKKCLEVVAIRYKLPEKTIVINALCEFFQKKITEDRILYTIPRFYDFYKSLFSDKEEYVKFHGDPLFDANPVPEKYAHLFKAE